MRHPFTKKFLIAITASALALSLTACSGAGPNAATRLIKRVTDGAEINIKTNENNISVSNLLLVAVEDGSAVVIGTMVNYSETKDTLLSISVEGIPAQLTGKVDLLRDVPVRFEGEQATSKAVFDSVGAAAGRNVVMTLSLLAQVK